MILVWCHRLAICLTTSLHFPLINMPISKADSRFYNWEVQRSQQTRSQGEMMQQKKKDAFKESFNDTSKHTSNDTLNNTSNDTLNNTSKDTSKDTLKDTLKDTSKDASKDTICRVNKVGFSFK